MILINKIDGFCKKNKCTIKIIKERMKVNRMNDGEWCTVREQYM